MQFPKAAQWVAALFDESVVSVQGRRRIASRSKSLPREKGFSPNRCRRDIPAPSEGHQRCRPAGSPSLAQRIGKSKNRAAASSFVNWVKPVQTKCLPTNFRCVLLAAQFRQCFALAAHLFLFHQTFEPGRTGNVPAKLINDSIGLAWQRQRHAGGCSGGAFSWRLFGDFHARQYVFAWRLVKSVTCFAANLVSPCRGRSR